MRRLNAISDFCSWRTGNNALYKLYKVNGELLPFRCLVNSFFTDWAFFYLQLLHANRTARPFATHTLTHSLTQALCSCCTVRLLPEGEVLHSFTFPGHTLLSSYLLLSLTHSLTHSRAWQVVDEVEDSLCPHG